MTLPDRITSRWIASLSDQELRDAELELHTAFTTSESAEKKRRGAAFDLARAPEALTVAWMRWSIVRNATVGRGLRLSVRR